MKNEIHEIANKNSENINLIASLLILEAQLLEKQENYSDAAIIFEQAINKNPGSIQSNEALFKLAKLRLRESDFYEAWFDIKRINKVTSKMSIFRIFIEAVFFVKIIYMKL